MLKFRLKNKVNSFVALHSTLMQFPVAKATLEVLMSVRLLKIKPSELKNQPLRQTIFNFKYYLISILASSIEYRRITTPSVCYTE